MSGNEKWKGNSVCDPTLQDSSNVIHLNAFGNPPRSLTPVWNTYYSVAQTKVDDLLVRAYQEPLTTWSNTGLQEDLRIK